MVQEAADGADDLEQLKRRFEEFRSTQTSRGRLPDGLWKEAAEVAKRYGLNPTAQALRLDYNRLKERMSATSGRAKRKREERSAPAFVELIGPALGGTSDCQIEVESNKGAKLRLELKGVRTSELASLIHAFIGQ
ncbi:MAG TPA: hypothetical protein VHZ55_33770 [Bryobacteraceae bacterium]|jgi:hypothetical protein|nr:hypothetical protein [Bryobacteraceae bacterium]